MLRKFLKVQEADGEVHAPLSLLPVLRRIARSQTLERVSESCLEASHRAALSAKSFSLSPSGYYLILAPVFTSLSSASTESIPSLSVAARSIPCDSIPMSFAGFRFARTTIFFPTRSSGA